MIPAGVVNIIIHSYHLIRNQLPLRVWVNLAHPTFHRPTALPVLLGDDSRSTKPFFVASAPAVYPYVVVAVAPWTHLDPLKSAEPFPKKAFLASAWVFQGFSLAGTHEQVASCAANRNSLCAWFA